MVVYSKGISFRKKTGQSIQKEEIEKTYVLDSNDTLEHFSYLLANTGEEFLDAVNEMVAYGEQELGERANDYLYLTLLDHIDFALKRAKKDQFIRSPLAWEVKKFYPKQFQIGVQALKILKRHFGVEFPDDEAVSIALHFVNLAGNSSQIKETVRDMQTLKDILSIIQFHYGVQFDEASLNYSRLITHLQYFIERLNSGRIYTDNDKELNNQVRNIYQDAYECVTKVRAYIKTNFQQELSIDEETYLMLHIHRVTIRKEE